jgi:hypothetical protein
MVPTSQKTHHTCYKYQSIKIIVFWNVTLCSLVDSTKTSEEHTASIFHPADGDSGFLWIIHTNLVSISQKTHHISITELSQLITISYNLTMLFGRQVPIFWRNLLPKHSILKMEAAGFFEILVFIYQITCCMSEHCFWSNSVECKLYCFIPEGSRRRENKVHVRILSPECRTKS